MEIPETKKVDVTPDTLISNESKKEDKKKEVKQPDPVIISDDQKNVDEVFENAEPLVKEIKQQVSEASNLADIDTIYKQYAEAMASTQSNPKNLDKMGISIPLSKIEDIQNYSLREFVQNQDKAREILNDMTSTLSSIRNSVDVFSEATNLLKEALEKLGDKIKDSLQYGYKGVGDAKATVYAKYKGQDRVTLDGAKGRMAFNSLTGGMRKITLWNSGITVTLRNIPLDALNEYYREVNHADYEYGKEFGAFYYLFADLLISEHIINNLLPIVICSSNYIHWKDTEKLKQAIAWQDFHTLLWAMGLMMHPAGATVNFVCAEEGCGHVHSEFVDLSKLRLLNTELLNDEVLDHFKKPGWVTDEDLVEFRKKINLNKSIEFDYDDGNMPKHWKVNLKQASVFDFLTVGRDYNTELLRHYKGTDRTEVHQYNTYNIYRSFKPWIDSIEMTIKYDESNSQTFILNNDGTDDNDRTVYDILDQFQQYSKEFGDLMKDYILSTKISHIAFYFPECPKCHKEPVNGYHGYVPYDPMQAFFTLALIKLLRGTSTSESSNT